MKWFKHIVLLILFYRFCGVTKNTYIDLMVCSNKYVIVKMAIFQRENTDRRLLIVNSANRQTGCAAPDIIQLPPCTACR